MSTKEFFETYLNSGQINDDTIIRMNTDMDEIVWLMEDYAKYILNLNQPNIVGSSIDMEVLDYDPNETNEWNNLHFSK